MDKDILLSKLESLRRCVLRIQTKTPSSLQELSQDVDAQDIIVLNLERAVQLCVDMSLHLISDLEVPIPESMAQTFDCLAQAGRLQPSLADRMRKAVGFRNIAVHAYQEIDWEIVYAIITRHLDDFRDFSRQMMQVITIPDNNPET